VVTLGRDVVNTFWYAFAVVCLFVGMVAMILAIYLTLSP
jgi:hypothetical protein